MKKEVKSDIAIHQEVVRATQSYSKTLNYIKGLLEDSRFQKETKLLRQKYNLPPDGLPKVLYKKILNKLVITYPDYLENDRNFYKEIDLFADEYGLDFLWAYLIRHYVVYNNLDISSFVLPLEIFDLKETFILKQKPDKNFGLVEYEASLDYLELRAKTHPIALLINPYASQREIVDFVKKLYKQEIEPLQKKYKKAKAKFNKIRKRSEYVRKRNKFIYSNKNLSSKKIQSLVYEKFKQFLDYTYINKIISDQENK